jgi:hypothetical protein
MHIKPTQRCNFLFISTCFGESVCVNFLTCYPVLFMIACNYKYQQNVAAVEKLRNLWLPPRLSRIVTSSRFLRGLRWVDSTVSELPICPIFLDSLTLMMKQIGRPETSLSNYLTQRNRPADGIIQLKECFIQFILFLSSKKFSSYGKRADFLVYLLLSS